jgi:hypothetical protein
MVVNEKINNLGTHKVDWYGGIPENVWSRLRKQAAEIVWFGFSNEEYGGSDGDDIRRRRERRSIRWLREKEGV